MYSLYSLDHFAYAISGLSVGTTRRWPRIGSPTGPGGKGYGVFFFDKYNDGIFDKMMTVSTAIKVSRPVNAILS